MSDATYLTQQGDVLDRIVHHHYGLGADAVTTVLTANPHLRGLPAVLPIGTVISLPAIIVDVELPAAAQTLFK